MLKINNIVNNNGNKVANQFVIYDDIKGEKHFQSYNSLVCIVSHTKNTIIFGRDWDYSNTTMRHLRKFLQDEANIDLNSTGIRKAIKLGSVENRFCIYTVEYKEGLK